MSSKRVRGGNDAVPSGKMPRISDDDAMDKFITCYILCVFPRSFKLVCRIIEIHILLIECLECIF